MAVQHVGNEISIWVARRMYALLFGLVIVLCGLGWAFYVGASVLWVGACALVILIATGVVMYLNQTQLRVFSKDMHSRMHDIVSLSHDIVAGKNVILPSGSPQDVISHVTESIHALLIEQQGKIGKLRITDHVFTTAGEAILVSDVDGKIVDVNPQLLKVTGYAREQLIGRPAGMLYRNNAAQNSSVQIRDGLIDLGHWRGETHRFHASAGCGQKHLLQSLGVLRQIAHDTTDPPNCYHNRTDPSTGHDDGPSNGLAILDHPN